MNVLHDQRMKPPDWELWIEKGLALDGVSSIALNYRFTQSDLNKETLLLKDKSSDEQDKIRQEQILARNEQMKVLMDEIAFRFPCYQYEKSDEIAYEGQNWDFFFWCRDFDPPLQGRDYSYITLGANESQTPQRQEQAFAGLLALLENLCGDNLNLDVIVQHQLRYNEARYESTLITAKRELPGRLCTRRGLKGTLALFADGLQFVPRLKRKEPTKISDTDMIRLLWIIEDGKAGEYLCLD